MEDRRHTGQPPTPTSVRPATIAGFRIRIGNTTESPRGKNPPWNGRRIVNGCVENGAIPDQPDSPTHTAAGDVRQIARVRNVGGNLPTFTLHNVQMHQVPPPRFISSGTSRPPGSRDIPGYIGGFPRDANFSARFFFIGGCRQVRPPPETEGFRADLFLGVSACRPFLFALL